MYAISARNSLNTPLSVVGENRFVIRVLSLTLDRKWGQVLSTAPVTSTDISREKEKQITNDQRSMLLTCSSDTLPSKEQKTKLDVWLYSRECFWPKCVFHTWLMDKALRQRRHIVSWYWWSHDHRHSTPWEVGQGITDVFESQPETSRTNRPHTQPMQQECLQQKNKRLFISKNEAEKFW